MKVLSRSAGRYPDTFLPVATPVPAAAPGLGTALSAIAAAPETSSVARVCPVTDAQLLTGSRLRTARVVSVGIVSLVAAATVVALIAYPSWQLALAALCVVPCPVILWFGLGRWLAPFAPGVRASTYLLSAVPPVLVVVLLALGGWLLSSAPI